MVAGRQRGQVTSRVGTRTHLVSHYSCGSLAVLVCLCSTDHLWPNPVEYSTPRSQIHAAEKSPPPRGMSIDPKLSLCGRLCIPVSKTVLLIPGHLVPVNPKPTAAKDQASSLEGKLFQGLVLSYIGNMDRSQCPHSSLAFPDSAGKSGALLKFTL